MLTGEFNLRIQSTVSMILSRYVPAGLAAGGVAVEVEVNGEMYSAKVVGTSL
jgi:hypothetical protein